MPSRRLLILLGMLLTALFPAQAGGPTITNVAREKNWAEQVVDAVVVGEVVWLNARQHKFLNLYAPPTPAGPWGVILLHGRGVHPAWGFIDTLRADLADAGFHTLSIQLPILAQDAKFGSYGQTFPEAYERIDSGIRYLKQKGVKHIVLFGHSTGAMTAVAYVAKRPETPIAGIVAVGLSTFANGPEVMQPAIMLKSVRVPILDLYGANDLHEVLSYVAVRRNAAATAGNKAYQAIAIPDTDHFFTDQYDELKKRTLAWLLRLKGK